MRFAVLAIAGLLSASPAIAGEAPPLGVVELFTSQGCSSCPPADRLAGEIADGGRTLVLTLPVDYWDYLGWRDTLANPANTARQRAYAMARGDRKVYTPQMVVNGQEATVGGDSVAVFRAISRAESGGGLLFPVTVAIEDGRIAVSVAAPARPTAIGHAEVWAFAVERSHVVRIGRGENAGRDATYANVVRHMTRLGIWEGASAKFDIAADEVLSGGADSVAVLVQAGTGGQPGAILGAGSVDAQSLTPTATSRLARDPY